METWYILEDGSSGDPRDIAAGDDGKLVHHDGRRVSYAAHGPRSRSVDPEAERAKVTPPEKQPFGGKGDHDGDGKAGGSIAAASIKDMKPEASRGAYKTRETRSR